MSTPERYGRTGPSDAADLTGIDELARRLGRQAPPGLPGGVVPDASGSLSWGQPPLPAARRPRPGNPVRDTTAAPAVTSRGPRAELIGDSDRVRGVGRTGYEYRTVDPYGVPTARHGMGTGGFPYPESASRPSGPHNGRHRVSTRATAGRRGGLSVWQEIPLLLMIAFVLATVIKTFLIQAFFIPSGSMEQTLLIKDRVLVNKFVYDMREPHRGDVVVFRGTQSWAPEGGVVAGKGAMAKAGQILGGFVGAAPPDEKDFVKRIIGVGGDTVKCCDSAGRVEVNGIGLSEPYVYQDSPIKERAFGPIVVPAGRLFMMGDHRSASADSRVYIGDQWKGTIPLSDIIGQAYATAWPPTRWGLLSAPDTFSKIPAALGNGTRAPPGPAGGLVPAAFPILFGPLSAVLAGRAPRWPLRPDSRRRRRLRG